MRWAYAREKVHLARPIGMPGLPSQPPRGVADSTLAMGGGSGGGNIGFEAPVDAYAVLYAVEALGGIASTVREYAMIGHAPEWTPIPMIRVKRGDTVLDRRNRRPLFCEFQYVGDLPEHVRQRRERYSRWAQAIADVHKTLSSVTLQRFTLLPTMPPLAPWGLIGS